MRQWRLIYDHPANGAYNMAVDMAILEAVAAGDFPPILRFYGWNPPCLSLGYGQRSADVDFARADAQGWDVVRRPTGGRAILHINELTYSLALPAHDPIAAGSVTDSYQRISKALVNGLMVLGLQPAADHQADATARAVSPVCFETPSHYEITVDSRKLIGSAQVRRGGGVLQHGSLPLYGDVARICDALAYADDDARESAKALVRDRAITLAETMNSDMLPPAESAHFYPAELDTAKLEKTFTQAFAETFAVQLEVSELSPAESQRAEQLMHEQYGTAAWTRRR